MDSRAIGALLAVSILLNGALVAYARNLQERVEDFATGAPTRLDVAALGERLAGVATDVAELRRASALASESAATPDLARATCASVPVRFTAVLNRLPPNATVSLVHRATFDAFADEGRGARLFEPPAVVNATRRGGLLFEAVANLSTGRDHAYFWYVSGPSDETTPAETISLRDDGRDRAGVAMERVNRTHARVLVEGSPDTPRCTRVAGGAIVTAPASGMPARYALDPPAEGRSAWVTVVPVPVPPFEIVWTLNDGRIVRWDGMRDAAR